MSEKFAQNEFMCKQFGHRIQFARILSQAFNGYVDFLENLCVINVVIDNECVNYGKEKTANKWRSWKPINFFPLIGRHFCWNRIFLSVSMHAGTTISSKFKKWKKKKKKTVRFALKRFSKLIEVGIVLSAEFFVSLQKKKKNTEDENRKRIHIYYAWKINKIISNNEISPVLCGKLHTYLFVCTQVMLIIHVNTTFIDGNVLFSSMS